MSSLWNFRGAPTKPLSEYSDKDLIKYIIDSNAGVMDRNRAVKEAHTRGLTNPKNGKPY